MKWRVLMAVLVGLLVLGASGAIVHAEKYPTPEASGKIIGYEKIAINGMEVPLRKTSNGMILIGQTSKVGRGEILEKVNQLMVNRVLNKWNRNIRLQSNYGNTIIRSDSNYRITTLN